MTVAPTSGTTSTSNAAGSAASSAAAGLTGDFNTFLTLLTTQLQNQDPTSPMDTDQFTQQLVSFSEVEQQINTNKNLSTLISLQNSNQLVSLLPTVGKTIDFTGATTTLASGGSANFSYSLANASASTTLSVTDQSGAVVWAGTGETGAGAHNFSWNGTTSSGGQAPSGVYTLNVTAAAADGSAVTVTQSATATVNSIEEQNGSTVLDIGGYQVPVTNLISVGGAAS
jgi:flagellar basal-body rod modification protein FlgD